MYYLIVFLSFSTAFWLIYRNTYMWLISSWLHNEYYSHGFIILIFCLIIIVLNGLKVKKIQMHLLAPLVWIIAGIVCASAGIIFHFRYCIALAYIFLSIALTAGILEPRIVSYIKRPLLLMILILPLPYMYEIAGYLSYATAKTAAAVLKIVYPSTVINGIAIVIPPDVEFTIGLSCSGANSILALITIVILWLVVIYNKRILTVSMVLCTIPVGFCANVLRIILIFIIARSVGVDRASQMWHDCAGYVFYIISLSMMFILWWMVRRKEGSPIVFRRLIIS